MKSNGNGVLVVLQLSGGNDYFNTVSPYADPRYRDYRPTLGIPEAEVLRLDDKVGFNPSMGPLRELYQRGKVAVIHGIGYANSSRSHFRSMDIWHTAEPDKVGFEGWLGQAIRSLDPRKDNPVLGINFGYSLPRALACPDVAVACVSDLNTYGYFPTLEEQRRSTILERFANIYSPAMGTGPTIDYLTSTGMDAMKGADILKVAPSGYQSDIEYPNTSLAGQLRGIAQVHLAGVGTRIFYCEHGSFDTHASQAPQHAKLWDEVSGAVSSFFEDLWAHNAADDVMMLVFSEFGRRCRDNGSGTDHGSGGVAFAIGDGLEGGQYSEYPSTKQEDLQDGDLVATLDFRTVYATILEQWLGADSKPIVKGSFEQLDFVKQA